MGILMTDGMVDGFGFLEGKFCFLINHIIDQSVSINHYINQSVYRSISLSIKHYITGPPHSDIAGWCIA